MPVPGPPARGELDIRIDGVRVKLADVPSQRVDKLISRRSLQSTGRGDTPSRAKIFVCKPAGAADEEPCAAQDPHRPRAPGLPPARERDPEIRPLLAFYKSGRAEGDFDRGIEKALRAMLVSPASSSAWSATPPERLSGRLPDFRLRAGLAPLVLPVEQHSG